MVFQAYLAVMKSIFSTTYSTLSPHALSDLLAERYFLKTIQCAFLVRGVGDTYLVNSLQGRFILRIYRSTHRSLSHVQADVALLMALKQAGVSVSYPITDRMQASIQQLNAVEGLRYAVLFSYAPGQPQRILNKSQLRTLGHEIARFH